MSRRPLVSGQRYEATMVRRPRRGPLRVLLIVNPTQDLGGAEEEGLELRTFLEEYHPAVELVMVDGDARNPEQRATLDRVRTLLRSERFDVVHYAGHARFASGAPADSGLSCADGGLLTPDELGTLEHPPAFVFLNACESGRVRGDEDNAAPGDDQGVGVVSGLAEGFLRAGVGHFLGSFWAVEDRAASCFSTVVYTKLIDGESFGDAVLAGRRELKRKGLGHWFNYVFYGTTDVRLVES